MKKQMWFTQEIVLETSLFSKDYFWMKDIDGHLYLARAVPNVTGYSVNPATGLGEPVIDGLKPVFA